MKVLFVCTGNTCRSPMAEAIFNSKTQNMRAFSAGVSAVPGSATTKEAAEVVFMALKEDISSRKAIQLSKKHLEEADLILTMTRTMENLLSNYFQEFSNKIFTLNEYVGVKGDIIDPYGGSINIYQKTYNDLESKISLLLEKIQGDGSL